MILFFNLNFYFLLLLIFFYFFDSDGCEAVVKLEDLQKHIRNCNYHPNAEIICDKGCNIKMSRHEYNTTTCLDHHKAEIEQLFASACSEESNYPMTTEDDNALKLIDEYILQQCDVMDVVEDKKWHVFHNMKESADTEDNSNILECDNKSPYAFAQSFSCLDTTNSFFRIKIVNLDCVKYIAIGVTSKGHPIDKLPGLHMGSLGYDSLGDFIVGNKSKNLDLQWKVGDIIECGIKFPSNCTNDSRTDGAMLYFSRNKKIVAEESIKMPSDGYFPTIYMYEGIVGSMWGSGNAWSSNTSAKVKYFTN